MDDNTFLPAGSPLTSGEKKVLEGKLIEYLSKQPVNTLVTYEKMTEIMGVDVKDMKTGKSVWLRAQKVLRRDGIYYAVVNGKGVQRGENKAILAGVDQCNSRMRNQAKKALKLLSIVDTKKLTSEEVGEYNSKCGVMGMMHHVLSPVVQKQVTQHFQNTTLDFSDTLKALGAVVKPKESES